MSGADPRLRVLGLLRRYGWNTTSFQVLEPGYRYWFTDDGEGAVAYADTGRWWVAAGAPICDNSRLAEVAETFVTAGRQARRKVAFFGSTRRLRNALAHWDNLLIGLEACWNPATWSSDAAARTQVRSQTRRAMHKGLTIREANPGELDTDRPERAEAERLLAVWLRGKNMAPLGFLARLDPFTVARERRYFLAEKAGRLMGMLAAVPVYTRNGWFLEHLVIDPQCPPGTSEALVDAAMVSLEAAGATFASMGMVALAGVGEPSAEPDAHPLLRMLLHRCYRSLNWLYGFQGLRVFRNKFKPRQWEPVYLVSSQPITLGTVRAVLSAFAGGRLGRFAARTGQQVLARWLRPLPDWAWYRTPQILSMLLIPWIAVLLTVDGDRWFGSAWVAQAWASFDVVVAALFALLGWGLEQRAPFCRWLSRVLLGVVLGDVWLTSAQALLYHGAAPYTPLETVVRWAAVGAPWLAALYLILLLVVRRR